MGDPIRPLATRVVFEGYLALPKYEIVGCGVFYEVTFSAIPPKNLLGDFLYSLNHRTERRGATRHTG